MNEWFNHVATKISQWTGRSIVFVVAIFLIIIWMVSGPIFQFSDTWQLIINTSTTIITFLMVFLIQNTQNRDTSAMEVKLDLLLRANGLDDKDIRELETKSDTEIEKIQKRVQKKGRK